MPSSRYPDSTSPQPSTPTLRIAVVVSHLPRNDNGGAERQAERAALELARRGHDVSMFVRGRAARCYQRDGISIVERPELRLSRASYASVSALRFSWDVAYGVAAVARTRGRFDAVLTYHTFDAGFVGTAASLATHTPQVLWIRSEQEYRSTHLARGRLLAPLVWLASQTILVQTPTIAAEFSLAASRLLPPCLATRVKRKVQVMANGLDVPNNTSPPAGTRDILFVGRLHRWKGLEYVIQALPMIPSASLTIVGEGPDRPRLERLAAGQPVTFVGPKSHDELANYYRRADLLVLASTFGEGLPNVVLEAMASGRPVVATRTAGVVDVVRDGINGVLVEPGDASALAGALGSLLADSRCLLQLGAGARETAGGYTWDVIIPRLAAVLLAASTSRQRWPGLLRRRLVRPDLRRSGKQRGAVP